MSWPGTTDQLRSLFLKGFKLSKQGNYEDPTYLGFKIVVDFGTLPIDPEMGVPPSPLFKTGSYEFGDGNSGFFSLNPFGQPQYSVKKSGENISYYSAQSYLAQREEFFQTKTKRADMLAQFSASLRDLLENHPWFIQSIAGLDDLIKVERGGYVGDNSLGDFNPSRTSGKPLTFSCMESLNLRMTALGELYKQATFDPENMRDLVPRNLRKFKMFIFVQEIRNFFKTSRLIANSTTLTAINNVSNLVGSTLNPGSTTGQDIQKQFDGAGVGDGASNFSSSAGQLANDLNLGDITSTFRDQSDQSGIKPVLIIECSGCEFNFDDSTSVPNIIDNGSQNANAATYSFKVHVQKVRTKWQFPNIRQDGKPLILGDSWDNSKSSVQQIRPGSFTGNTLLGGFLGGLANSPAAQNALSVAGDALTNFVGNSVNDMINEGIQEFVSPALNGLDKTLLGNIYSFNPSELLARPSFNSAQNFLDQLGNIDIRNLDKPLPNPQTMGLGGPLERVYNPPGGEKDNYRGVPGRDLGVNLDNSISRVYTDPPKDDFYTGSPGGDLGVPDRVYPDINDDAYNGTPGGDLGVPDRVYAPPGGDSDAYPQSPGAQLGVPDRVYPEPEGDFYPDSPGAALGVPDRVYTEPEGDAYASSPGADLGVPDRVYAGPDDDAYTSSPGESLGVPDRVYIQPEGDVYSRTPGEDLGVPDRVYPAPKEDAYSNSPGSDLGVPDRVYGSFTQDVYEKSPGSDLGVPERVYSAPKEDVYTSTPGPDLGVPARSYPSEKQDVYESTPGPDLGVPARVYTAEKQDVYETTPGPDLGVPSRIYTAEKQDVYETTPGPDLGVPSRAYTAEKQDVYEKVPGQDLGTPSRLYPPTEGDVYSGSPGTDLGVPDRIYNSESQDVYTDSPGSSLGVPERVYSSTNEDVYTNNPGSDLGVPGRNYPGLNEKVYAPQQTPDVSFQANNALPSAVSVYQPQPAPTIIRGDLGKIYPKTVGDFVMDQIMDQSTLELGNIKPADRYNASLGDFNPPSEKFLED
jgi:hypothetical protein